MKTSSHAQLAKKYLENRPSGPRYLRSFRNAPIRMGAGLAIGLLGVLLYWQSGIPIFLLVCGLGFGSFLRDIGWFRGMKRTWSFVDSITDWNKVEAIAKGDGEGTERSTAG